ncbi:hypothetical protein IV64_GL001968 [Lactiplantibacillus xiangfangensis]|uniref:Uncharacterized protein n=1 Tax=Lactiplantibacillus xiangfangensis TaxID=942150 RepID=A0A0R2MJU9_9LACO|nr:hypothetical protein IV64_GL001968 [Lactiplantibacillus xiangfangensis]
MGDGRSHTAVCDLDTKPTARVFVSPRKISRQETSANLADTAHQDYPTALKTVLLLLLLTVSGNRTHSQVAKSY